MRTRPDTSDATHHHDQPPAAEVAGKILVIDDDRVTREVLQEVLATHGYEVALAENLETARELAGHHLFDLIFLDLVFSQQLYSGFDIIKCIRKHQALCPIVLITAHPSTDSAIEALRENVFDYLMKPLRFDELAAVTARAMLYKSKLDETEQVKNRFDMKNAALVQMTEREKEVLGLFVKGFSYAEAAEQLGIKLSTLQTYTKSIYKKLGVHSRTEAIHEAICLLLVEP